MSTLIKSLSLKKQKLPSEPKAFLQSPVAIWPRDVCSCMENNCPASINKHLEPYPSPNFVKSLEWHLESIYYKYPSGTLSIYFPLLNCTLTDLVLVRRHNQRRRRSNGDQD